MSYERLFNRLGVLALFLALVVVAGVAGWHALLHTYAGAWTHQPEDADWLLPAASRQLIADSLGDLDGAVPLARLVVDVGGTSWLGGEDGRGRGKGSMGGEG